MQWEEVGAKAWIHPREGENPCRGFGQMTDRYIHYTTQVWSFTVRQLKQIMFVFYDIMVTVIKFCNTWGCANNPVW